MVKIKIYFSFISLLIILSSCKSTQLQTETVHNKIPKTFHSASDSTSKPIIKWKELYFDPYLIALIDSALIHNFDLKLALQKIELSKASLKSNKGIRLPELGATASASQRKFGDYTMDGVGNYDSNLSPNLNDKQKIPNPYPDYVVGFQTSWEIDLWGKLKNKKKSAANQFIASQYGKDLITTQLIAEIASSYFELLALDKEIQILNDNINLQQAALELVMAQKEVGRANELGVSMMKAQLLNSKVFHTKVEQEIINIESHLNYLCGTYPKSISRDTAFLAKNIQKIIETGVPSDLLKNRPDIKQAEYTLKAANADVKSAQAAFYPALNINANLGLQAFNSLLLLETPASLAYGVFGGLTAPLLNRRKIKAELMLSKAEQKQAYINYEKTINTSFKEVFVSVNNIKNSQSMLLLKNEESQILKESISTAQDLFRAGRANYLEIITAQKNALQSQIELIDLYKRQNLALINLYKSIGGGWQ